MTAKDELQFERLHGAAIRPVVDELARLRIDVFQDFPYLYDGDLSYERAYLQTYVEAPDSLAFMVRDAGEVVGATTALPLADEEPAFRQPVADAGFDVNKVFYFGESLLLGDYRGGGLGHRFFDEREAWARSLGRFDYCLFCAVDRPPDHPLRPADYRPLDSFWQGRGYRPQPALRARYRWQDIGQAQETEKTLTFWVRPLA